MSKLCMVTGKGTAHGNIVAHCNKKIKRTFGANVHWRKLWSAAQNRFVRIRISNHGLRIIDKRGLDVVLAELNASGQNI